MQRWARWGIDTEVLEIIGEVDSMTRAIITPSLRKIEESELEELLKP